jgi:hypothetical protein
MVPAPKGSEENPPANYYKTTKQTKTNQVNDNNPPHPSQKKAARLIEPVEHSARNNAQHLEMLVLHIGKRARHHVFLILGTFLQSFNGATDR